MPESVDELFIDVVGRLDEDSIRVLRRRIESVGEEAGEEGGNAITRGMGGALQALPAIATAAAAAVGAAVVAGTVNIVNLASEAEANVRMFKTEMGLAQEQAEELGQAAENAFRRGVGDSLAEAGEAIRNVKREFSDLSNQQIEELAVNSSKIAKTFKQEQKDVSEAIKALSRTRDTSIEQATDLLTAGFQNGLDISDDLLDTIREYGPQFEKAGVSGQELFNILINGAKSGTLGTDKVADAFKEFTLVAGDGSKKTASAFEDLGLSYDKIEADIKSGATTYGEVFGQVTERLKNVEDVALRTDITAALFGGAGEDLANGIAQIDLTKKTLEGVEGATKRLRDDSQSLGEIGTKIWREIQVAALPVGKAILELANDAMPAIREAIQSATPFISKFALAFAESVRTLKAGQTQASSTFSAILDTVRSVFGAIAPYIKTVFGAIAPIVTALVPVVEGVFSIIGSLWTTVLKPVLDTVYPVFKTAFELSAAQIKIFVDIVAGALNALASLIKGDTAGAVEILKKTFVNAGQSLQAAAQRMSKNVIDALSVLGPKLKELAINAVNGYIQSWLDRINSVKRTAQKFVNAFLGTANEGFDVRSPSRKMALLAQFVSDGFINKISSDEPKIKKSGQDMAKAFLDSLSELKTEREVGRIDLSGYIKTLENARDTLNSKLNTVKRGTPAYSSWLGALSKVTGELDKLTGKSSDAAKAAKKLADEIARNKERIEAIENAEKYNKILKLATDQQLENALAVAKEKGEIEKYNAIKAEQTRRVAALTAAQEKGKQAAEDYKRAQEEAFKAAQDIIKQLDQINLGGLDARLGADPAIEDTVNNFAELQLQIDRLRGDLEDPNTAKAWISAINEMRSKGQLTAKQVTELTNQIKNLQNVTESGPSLPRGVESVAPVEPVPTAPSQVRGEVEELKKEVASASRVTADFGQEWDKLQQKLANQAEIDRVAEALADLTDEELEAARVAAIAEKNVVRYTLAVKEQESRTETAKTSQEKLAGITKQLNKETAGSKAPFQDQLEALKQLEKTSPELAGEIAPLIRKIKELQGQAAETASFKKMQENLKEMEGQFNDIANKINIAKDILANFGGGVAGAADVIGTYFTTNLQAATQVLQGDYAGAVLTSIQGIIEIGNKIQDLDPAYGRWKKNIEETGELIKQNMGSRVINGVINPFFDSLERDLENRSQLSNANFIQRWWWNTFGGAPEVLDKEAAKLRSDISGIFTKMATDITGSLQGELLNAFDYGNWSEVAENMSDSLNKTIAKVALDYIVQTSQLAPKIAKFSEFFRKALVGGLDDNEKAELKRLYDDIISEQRRISGRYRAIVEDLPGYADKAREKQLKDWEEWNRKREQKQERAREKEREAQEKHIKSLPKYTDTEGKLDGGPRVRDRQNQITGTIEINLAPITELSDIAAIVAPQIERGGAMIERGAQRFSDAVEKFDRRVNWSKLNTVDGD